MKTFKRYSILALAFLLALMAVPLVQAAELSIDSNSEASYHSPPGETPTLSLIAEPTEISQFQLAESGRLTHYNDDDPMDSGADKMVARGFSTATTVLLE